MRDVVAYGLQLFPAGTLDRFGERVGRELLRHGVRSEHWIIRHELPHEVETSIWKIPLVFHTMVNVPAVTDCPAPK